MNNGILTTVQVVEHSGQTVTVSLRRPTLADLPDRARWMSDPATMAYNAVFDLPHLTYHRATGCLDFPREGWADWLDRCAEDAPWRFHAMVDAGGVVVGEAGFRIEQREAHLHLVIEARQAGRGYGSAALALVLAAAFARPDVDAVVDGFPADRAVAERLFHAHGFVRTGGTVRLARSAYGRTVDPGRTVRVPPAD